MNDKKERLIEIFKNTSFLKEIKKCLSAYENPALEIKEAKENSDYLLIFSEKDDEEKFTGLTFKEAHGHFFIEAIGEIYKPEGFKIKDKIDDILENPNIENSHKINIQSKKFWEEKFGINLPEENWEDHEIILSSQILIQFHSKNIISELMICIRTIKEIQNSNEKFSCVKFIQNEKKNEQNDGFVIIGNASTLKEERPKSPAH